LHIPFRVDNLALYMAVVLSDSVENNAVLKLYCICPVFFFFYNFLKPLNCHKQPNTIFILINAEKKVVGNACSMTKIDAWRNRKRKECF